jgi:hypothetical protein
MLIHVFASRHFLCRFHPFFFLRFLILSLSHLPNIQMHIFIQINALSTTLSMQLFAFVLYIYSFFLRIWITSKMNIIFDLNIHIQPFIFFYSREFLLPYFVFLLLFDDISCSYNNYDG